MDLGGYQGGVSADGDGISDPATGNGRLLWGRKGTLSAWERHPLQVRLTAGLLHKAQRGEWAVTLPTGLVRHGQGTVHKMPTQAAQARLSLVCATFVPCRSASQVVDICNRHALLLPRRDRCGEVLWQAPRGASVRSMLKPPASAGACTYGRTRPVRREATQRRPSRTRLPQAQWRICIPNVDPSSMSWETYTQLQTRLTEHHAEYDRHTTRGMPRPGKALVPGLVSGGACGHTLVVPYQGGPRSIWHSLRQPSRTPGCQ